MQDAVADFPRQVQPLAAALQALDDAQALLVVGEAVRQQLREGVLAPVAERRVAEVVPERDRFREVLVEVEGAG